MRRRSGFTIVELLVSMASIIFIMTILAEAFSAGTLPPSASLKRRRRYEREVAGHFASTLRKYLAADHFEGKKRLSNPTFWNAPPARASSASSKATAATSRGPTRTVCRRTGRSTTNCTSQ